MSLRPHAYHSLARVLCPTCRAIVDGVRLLRDGKVVLRSRCPEHGEREALLSSDADYFASSLNVTRPGRVPLRFAEPVAQGCPHDCGLCPDHEQHTCLPIIEITSRCDMKCPICIVEHCEEHEMSLATFGDIIDGLVASEGTLDAVSLSGGEPTLHPQLLDLIDTASRPEIARVAISTNGQRLAQDQALCAQLARRNVYVNLQFDGLDGTALLATRGDGDHVSIKRRALDNLERAGVATSLVLTLVRGHNESQIGSALQLLTERDFILSLLIQPAAYAGRGAGFEPHDPLDTITIPEALGLCAEQSGGMLQPSDFQPMPCSHPSCFALTYLLQTDDGFVPLTRFVDVGRTLDICANRATLDTDGELEDAMRETIDALWSSAGQIPDSDKILGTLERALDLMYPDDRAITPQQRMKIGEGLVKSVFIHAFMDAHSFDLERVRKCCTHYALPDGRLMPGCAYNVLHRNPPEGWPKPPSGKQQ